MIKRFSFILAFVPFCYFCMFDGVFAQDVPGDLTKMSIEDLMNMTVYSAAKKPEPVWDTSAAITVITQEDIARSGATNIPDLLRMVPGVRVEQINNNSWDISIRGFDFPTSSVFANKILVLIDGRSVYTPLYGGVPWNLQNVPLEDIDRIEIIRGPGGTLYGANAVNGVINIITKKAKDTQGGLISAGGGNDERGLSTTQYGGKAGDWYYRLYGKYDNYGKGFSTTGSNTDNWNMAQGGFRADRDKLTLQGDYYDNNTDDTSTYTTFAPPYLQNENVTNVAKGANLLENYVDEDWSLKTYWDYTQLDASILNEKLNQIDTEYNRLLTLSVQQNINWGLTYHADIAQYSGTELLTIEKPSQIDQVFSAYLQDEYTTLDGKWKFTLGSKFEHNNFTGFEFEPNARALYHINDTNEVWAAASRAIRTPSILENYGQITQALAPNNPVYERILGNDHLTSEKLRALELGYRNQLTQNVSWDLALFSDYYNGLSLINLGNLSVTTINGFPAYVFPYDNVAQGEVHGAEISSDIKINDWWKLTGYYSYIKMDLKPSPGFTNSVLVKDLNNETPLNATYVRSSFDLPHGFQFDATFRYMSSFYYGSIPSDPEVDLNLSKKINQSWQISMAGQNLIDSHHKEAPPSIVTTQVRRTWYVKITYRF